MSLKMLGPWVCANLYHVKEGPWASTKRVGFLGDMGRWLNYCPF